MFIERVSYETLIRQGNEALDAGSMPDAIDLFRRASNSAHTNIEEATALQMMSIAYSMDRDHRSARNASEAALKLVEHDPTTSGRITRDAGMILIRHGVNDSRPLMRPFLFSQAGMLFEKSTAFLGEEPGNELEIAVTVGFVGRLQLAMKKRLAAQKIMEGADDTIRNGYNRDYELNNLMWLIRAVPITERSALKARILPLIKQTGQTRRYDELRLIMIGGDLLYRFVDKRPWIPQLIRKVRGK